MFFTSKKDNKPLSKRNKWFFAIILILFFLSAGFLKLWQFHWSSIDISLSGQELHVLVAKTPLQWEKGLSNRKDLGANDGMIFVYPKAQRYEAVTRGVEFPIDVIWLSEGSVVDMAANVGGSPEGEAELVSYFPRKAANSVLQLKAGFIAKNGVKIGDVVKVIDK